MGLLRAVSGRVRSFRLIRSAVMYHGRRVAENLEKHINAFLPDHLKIDFWSYMQAILVLLRRRCDRLLGAESELVGERGNDPGKRRRRDLFSKDVRRLMQRFRNAFEANYMPDDIEEYGFSPALSTVPLEVLRQADHLIELFRKREIPEPEVGPGLPLDELIEEIVQAADRLREQLDEVDRENRLVQSALVDKDRAVSGWDDVLPWASRTLSDLFRQAGEHELAAQLLPSSRPGRIVQVEEEDEDPGDTGSEDTGSEDTGSEDTGSEDTGSEDTGSEDTGSEDTGSGV